MLSLAWACYGVASSLESGTLDAQVINELKQRNKDKFIAHFISNTNRLDLSGLLIGGTIGSWLYYSLGLKFYLVSIVLTLMAFFVIKIGYREPKITVRGQDLRQSLVSQMVTGINELKKSPSLRLLIALNVAGQFFFQTHYQLWQALFLQQSFNKKEFYLYYIIFQVLGLVAYSLPMPVKVQQLKVCYLGAFCGFVGGLTVLNLTEKTSFLVSYFGLIFEFTIFEYFSNVLFSKIVSPAHISSLTSLRSSCGRIAALVALLLSSLLLTFLSPQVVVSLNFGLAIVLSLSVLSVVFKPYKQ